MVSGGKQANRIDDPTNHRRMYFFGNLKLEQEIERHTMYDR
jgi:hypothetical protein